MTSKQILCRVVLIHKIPARILQRLIDARVIITNTWMKKHDHDIFEEYLCLVGQVVARIHPSGTYFCDASDAEDILIPALDYWRIRNINLEHAQNHACLVQVMITSRIYLRHALSDPRNLLPVIRGYCL